MKEFLIIGNTVEIKQIDSADICYILASKNSSYIYVLQMVREFMS